MGEQEQSRPPEVPEASVYEGRSRAVSGMFAGMLGCTPLADRRFSPWRWITETPNSLVWPRGWSGVVRLWIVDRLVVAPDIANLFQAPSRGPSRDKVGHSAVVRQPDGSDCAATSSTRHLTVGSFYVPEVAFLLLLLTNWLFARIGATHVVVRILIPPPSVSCSGER